jgi:hypothetical protein
MSFPLYNPNAQRGALIKLRGNNTTAWPTLVAMPLGVVRTACP